MTFDIEAIPDAAVGLQLARITRAEELILCEPVRFVNGAQAVRTTLRRASISGLVEFAGATNKTDYFADVLDENQDILETIALDRKSYRALKTKWMRCKVERVDRAQGEP